MTEEYIETECDDKGQVKERKGLKQIKDMRNEGKAMVFPTDKSGKFCIDTYENYVAGMEEHVIKDRIITRKEKEKIIRQLNGHSNMLSKSLGLCRDHCQPDGERPAAALKQDVKMIPPTTSGLRKDNKPPKESEEKGQPMKPVCHVYAAPNNVLSTILAQIIRTLAEKAENRAIASTEEMIATINITNEKVRTSTRKIGIGSMDCKALYPSLSREWVKKIISQMDETNVTTEVVN